MSQVDSYIIMLWLLPLFFLTAALYASVGFGGGSTYLALLTLAGLSYTSIPIIALACNITVVSLGSYLFIRDRQISWSLITPFLVVSIPSAYIGGRIPISKELFLFLLGTALMMASIRLFIRLNHPTDWKLPPFGKMLGIAVPIGTVLGFISGITGIGGGIFLAPVLYFLKWGGPIQIAAASSIFIFFNSVSGLFGQLMKNSPGANSEMIFPLMMTVFLGGWIGHQIGFGKVKAQRIQRLTAALIFVVAVNVLWKWYKM